MDLDNYNTNTNTPGNSPTKQHKKRGVPKKYTDEELKERRKETVKRYMQSEKGKAAYRRGFDRYRQTEKYKESLRRIYDKRKGMAYSSEEDVKELPELIDYEDVFKLDDDYE